MVKYFATVRGRVYEVEIEQERVLIDGVSVTLDMRQSGVPELHSLLLDGASYEVLIEARRQVYDVSLGGKQFHVQVEDERTRRLNAGRQAPLLPLGDLPVKAPIPGLVVKVLVAVGERVAIDQPLAILEAMKMENEIRAPRNGEVKQVEVVAGARVEQYAVLLVLS